MVIGIDAREIQKGVVTGIGRALGNFLAFFDRCNDEHRIILFSECQLAEAEYGNRIVSIVAPPAKITIIWDQLVLLRLIRKHAIDLFYSPYYKLPLAAPVPIVSTIFDLMYIYYPVQWRGTSTATRLYYRLFGGLMVAKSHTIFTCSQYSKSEILSFYKCSDKKVAVIHLGLSERYTPSDDSAGFAAVAAKFGIAVPYILYTGNFKPHKNVAALIRAFEIVCSNTREFSLVLAGRKDTHFAPLQNIISKSTSAPSIIVTGLVSLDEQIALYRNALVFVCPSLYEGFGYPPLEAMACGTPVVSSDRTSLREIIGNAAERCNPEDPSDIAAKIQLFIADPMRRTAAREKGVLQAQNFTNKRYCEQFYRLLLSCGNHSK